ncbi:uncharacterized protein LOC112057222 [Bicyclus anynana]|uniref:Uncharacterized protein LOC112057222 n=1 Tax=Bicyclus anynana TaxID=110368 RepID=A0A6J1P6U0_BICAN|nr:uncharacterized protein LOC112057222 [Bicyclus anynana]
MMKRKVIKHKDSLIIKIQCETRPVKLPQSEEYCIFRAQLKDRIVPRCFRGKCRKHVQYKKKECNQYRQRELKQKTLNFNKKQKTESTQIKSTLHDAECVDLQYEDISSCTDDEIEILLKSTRKRMKDSDEEWQLLPKKRRLMKDKLTNEQNNNFLSRTLSQDSLKTLILEEDTEVIMFYTPITSPEQLLKLEPLETKDIGEENVFTDLRQKLKRKNECLHLYEDEHTYIKKKIKSEPLETNMVTCENECQQNILTNYTYQSEFELKALNPMMTDLNIKPEPMESNNNFILNHMPIEDNKIIYKINSEITKVERYDMDLDNLNLTDIDIKQELYHDI